jgi:hypothetical protein
LAREAQEAGVPPALIARKAFEGAAKGYPPDRIVTALESYAGRLHDVGPDRRPASMAAAAEALRRGVPPDAIRSLASRDRAAYLRETRWTWSMARSTGVHGATACWGCRPPFVAASDVGKTGEARSTRSVGEPSRGRCGAAAVRKTGVSFVEVRAVGRRTRLPCRRVPSRRIAHVTEAEKPAGPRHSRKRSARPISCRQSDASTLIGQDGNGQDPRVGLTRREGGLSSLPRVTWHARR